MELTFKLSHRTKTGIFIEYHVTVKEEEIQRILYIMRNIQIPYKEDSKLADIGEVLFNQYMKMMNVKEFLNDEY